ncbi:DUF2486 family protein [Burkholderia stagnalis]
MTQADSSSIPTLTDVLVPGNPARARSPEADAPRPHDAAIPVLTDVIAPGRTVAAPAAPNEIDADPDAVVVGLVPTPDVPAVELLPGGAVATASAAAVPAEPAAEPAVAGRAAMDAPLHSALAAGESSQPGFAAVPHEPVGLTSDAAILPEAVVAAADGPVAAAPLLDAAVVAQAAGGLVSGASQPGPQALAVPAAVAAALTPEDAQHIAERLRNRLTNYLTGAGREAIEARCRDALHEHSAWLVGQITREVALALETEVMDWVRDAVDEEIGRRRTGQAG